MSAPATTTTTVRPFYWSVRREIWENRSLYLGPMAAAAFAFVAFLIASFRLPHRVRAAEALDVSRQITTMMMPFSLAAMFVLGIAFLIGIFYGVGALYGERRDRSILFWKSLPVSDRTTVLAKAFVLLAVLPAIVFAVVVVLQLVMLLWTAALMAAAGLDQSMLWSRVPLLRVWLILAYGLITQSLWYAPIVGWLLLVSVWAKRTPIVWAIAPPAGLMMFEKIAFNHAGWRGLVSDRLGGDFKRAFVVPEAAKGDASALGPMLPHIDPIRFLTSPGLWGGLIVAALMLYAAIRLRRSRDPI